MKDNRLDDLPYDVQQAILSVFKKVNVRDKIILLARLEYGNDISYRELSDITGVTLQCVQQVFDKMLDDIRKSPYIVNAPYAISGVRL